MFKRFKKDRRRGEAVKETAIPQFPHINTVHLVKLVSVCESCAYFSVEKNTGNGSVKFCTADWPYLSRPDKIVAHHPCDPKNLEMKFRDACKQYLPSEQTHGNL